MRSVVKSSKAVLLAFMLPACGFAGGNKIPRYINVIPVEDNTKSFYVGIGGSEFLMKRDTCACAPDTPDLEDHRFGVLLRAGWEYSQYVAFEVRASKSLESGGFTETEHYGFYVKPQYPLTETTKVYGLIGYGKTTVDYDSGTRSSHNPSNSFSFGGGISYDIPSSQPNSASKWQLWIDAQSLLRNESWMHTDANTLSLGVSYFF